MRTNNITWFSSIVAILLTAFLVIVSSWVLWIVLQESKNTRIVYNSISTYAWAEWAQEYGLLKIKNHEEWFQDKVVEGSDYDSKLLANDPDNTTPKDQFIEYSMNTFSTSYSGSVESWEFDVIPLFYDKGSAMQPNSKKPEWTDWIENTNTLKFSWDNDFVWNIIWNNATGDTFWMVWTWAVWINTGWWYAVDKENWQMKKILEDANIWWDTKLITFESMKIKDFIDTYEHNYLIIFNPTDNKLNYFIESNEWFANPKTSITASARIWNYKQNLLFEENKNRYFEALKYSIINK